MKLKKIALVLVCSAFATMNATSKEVDSELSTLLSRLQKRYDGIQTLAADFKQSYTSKRFDKEREASGKLKVKKPGKMRWDYSIPKGKVLTSDGDTITMYNPEDRQAIVSEQPKDQNLPAAITFLSGSGNFQKSFDFSWIQKPTDGQAVLKATPKKREPNLKEMELTISLKGEPIVISTVIVDDLEGRNRVSFSDIKINPSIKDQEFKVKLPKKATVITQ